MAPSRKPVPDPVAAALTSFLGANPNLTTLRVALSGGRDSTVLLHALARLDSGRTVVPLHVHHGLHPRADAQAEHCRQLATGLGLRCEVHEIRVPARPAGGIEAAARGLRYRALSEGMAPSDCVLTAHHATDQAETFLLAALKGSGPAGLAAMPALRRLGTGWLGRPLLAVRVEAIAAYGQRHQLRWVEDPTNEDTRFDRNFLRREVLPVLCSRFPAARRLGLAAALQAEAVQVLDGLLDPLLDALGGPGEHTLDLGGLLEQPAARRPWLLRRFLARARATAPRRGPLLEFIRQLEEADAEASPALHWDGFSLGVYRGVLHLLSAADTGDPGAFRTALDWPSGARELTLPDGRVLTREALQAAGVRTPGGVQICFREGGEILHTPAGRRSLKTLMQERGIPPWRRNRIPLVRVNGELVAALWDA
jgi:tRNA(Ile)-lysidine synthase